MILKTFQNASDFLREAQPTLEAHEAANSLMYGIALRLQRRPDSIKTLPYLAVVRRKKDLQAAALMTPPHNLVVFCDDPDYAAEAFELVAGNLIQDQWEVPGVLGPSQAALAFAQIWQQLSGEAHTLTTRERVFELRRVIPPPQPPGGMRPAIPAEEELVARWLYDFWAEAIPHERNTREDAAEIARYHIAGGDFFVWEDGQPVALAGRTRPLPHSWSVGPVYTPLEMRGKGYATALTAALSQFLLDSGAQFTTLFTDLSNPTSNSIYQKIGYRPVCDFDLYTFS